MKEIPLTQGKVAFVDDEDYVRLAAFKWDASGRTLSTGEVVWYARRYIGGPGYKHRYMHHDVLGVDGVKVDHVNGDRLFNLRGNLRVATQRQNLQNQRRLRGGKTSQYKGVSTLPGGRWRATILAGAVVTGRAKQVYLGSFGSEEAAARAYDAAAKRYFGAFAAPNFSEVPCATS